MSKEERFARVAEAVVALMLHRGPAEVKLATIARKAGVSRPWLYKYFGAEPQEIIAFTVRAWGTRFAELDHSNAAPDVAGWRENILRGTRRGLRDAAETPAVFELLVRHRNAAGPLGDAVREIEARHRATFVRDIPASLKRDPKAAERFALVYSQACTGLYQRWADPRMRAEHDEHAIADELMALVDAFIHRGGRALPPSP